MDDDFRFEVESRLTSHGIYVDELRRTEKTYEITYESASVDTEDVISHREVGRVINVFRELHDEGWQGKTISAEVLDFDGVTRGHWETKQEWLDNLHNGDLTEVEFSQKVIETIEYVNGQ